MYDKEYLDGPDQEIPVNNYITWRPDEAVKIRRSRSGSDIEPVSIPGLMKRTVEEGPNDPALLIRDPNTLVEKRWTWRDYYNDVRSMAKAIINMGFQRFESVCILGFNTPEWFIADLAAIFAGGFAAGIYPTNGPDACKYILENSKCGILVVEDQKQLDKVWRFRDQLPNLKKIIQYSDRPTYPGVLSWQEVIKEGQGLPDDELEARLRRIAVNQCCTLVYTSGTTGNPKGVMLSHDGITWIARTATDKFNFGKGIARVLSYLPLSHVAANMFDIHAVMAARGATYFADKNCLKGTLKDNLLWCRPTKFVGVPRVYEKLMEKMLEAGKAAKGVKKSLAKKAKQTSLEFHKEGKSSMKFQFYQTVVLDKVKKLLGFDACDTFFVGAAPTDDAIFKYFLSLDIKIMELYGMSETTGCHTAQCEEYYKPRSVGMLVDPSMMSKTVKVDADDFEGREELWMWGRNIMMGYIYREDATKKDMTEDGWLKSGDLVEIDSEGFHFIVGREKDLIITAGGENVAPQPIHEAVKKHLPCLSQVFLIGDKQKFLSCFLTFAVEVNMDTMEPTYRLTSGARDWCESIGSSATTVQDILRGPDRRVMAAIQAGIDRANKEAVSNAQKIQKWTILPRDFSLPGGEMGPTMKVKRNEVVKKYQNCIHKIYGGAAMINGK